MLTSVALIGMPGGGKSSVGRQLARRLGCPFRDTDTLIEERIGEPIRSFFDREGEPRFREIEQQVLQDCLEHPAEGILATGGGIVVREVNRRLLSQRAITIYLHTPPDELARRLRHDTHRPMLQVADPRAKLRELYRVRDPLYRETARFVIETGRPSVPTLVGMILMQLELAGLVDPALVPSPVDQTTLFGRRDD